MNGKILAAALTAALALSAAAPAPAAVNLTHYQLSGWSGTVVPRLDANTTYFSCSVTDPLLTGDYYWNVSGANVGDESTGSSFDVTYYLDGEVKGMSAAGPTSTVFLVPNQGPLTNVHGGRHIVSAWIDAFHAVPETDETDNVHGHPFVWAGVQLTPATPLTRPAPPDAQGGWDHNVEGALWYNCSGFKFNLSPLCDWTVVAAYSEDPGTNYNLRLYEHNDDDPKQGYAENLGWSMRGWQRIDAWVLRNEELMVAPYMDVGVINQDQHTGDFTIVQHQATDIAFGVPETITKAAGDRICVRQLTEPSDLALMTSLFVTADPSLGEINAAVYAPGVVPTPLESGVLAQGGTVDGELRLDLSLAPDVCYGIVVWRDPEDGSGPWSFTLEADSTPADLVPDAGAWYAPLVPTNSGVKPGNPAYLPAELDADYTYMNFRYVNAGALGVKSPRADVDLDGVPLIESAYSTTLYPGEAVEYNSALLPPSPWPIGGGRHTLTLELDPEGRVAEADETNNLWGDQFCWKPENLYYLAIARYHHDPPPPMYGGHQEVTETPPLYNCDGYRLPVDDVDPDGWWRAAALYSIHEDYDLRLHESFVGNQGGFEGALATSSLPEGRLDFVIANLNEVPDAVYDVSVFNSAEPDPQNGYYVQSQASQWVANDTGGIFGPFEINNPGLLDLLEFHIPAGDVAIRLLSESETTDWGIALLPPDGGFMTLDDALAAAWGNGLGQDVWLTTVVPEDGYCGLLVWRCPPVYTGMEGHYRIWIEPGLTGVGPEVPAPRSTALTGAHPNPFNPMTTVDFELARRGRARLTVHDLKGRLVRTLVDAELPVGGHAADWDGRTAEGREAASGVYVLRLSAEGARDSRRISLVR